MRTCLLCSPPLRRLHPAGGSTCLRALCACLTGPSPSPTLRPRLRRYTVSAQAMVAGKLIPASNTLPLQMPAPGAPTLVDAQARSSTRGYALAAPPPGGCDTYVFTFAPVNGAGAGGQPVVRELADNQYNVGTLTPSTTYDVSVQCKKGGVLSGPSNVKQVGGRLGPVGALDRWLPLSGSFAHCPHLFERHRLTPTSPAPACRL